MFARAGRAHDCRRRRRDAQCVATGRDRLGRGEGAAEYWRDPGGAHQRACHRRRVRSRNAGHSGTRAPEGSATDGRPGEGLALSLRTGGGSSWRGAGAHPNRLRGCMAPCAGRGGRMAKRLLPSRPALTPNPSPCAQGEGLIVVCKAAFRVYLSLSARARGEGLVKARSVADAALRRTRQRLPILPTLGVGGCGRVACSGGGAVIQRLALKAPAGVSWRSVRRGRDRRRPPDRADRRRRPRPYQAGTCLSDASWWQPLPGEM